MYRFGNFIINPAHILTIHYLPDSDPPQMLIFLALEHDTLPRPYSINGVCTLIGTNMLHATQEDEVCR